MANPFEEAERKAKKAPGGDSKPVVVAKEVKVVEKEEKKNENLLAGMIEQKPEGKSYGFYLSTEAIEKLEKLAKQNKCSKSKALDTLLRSIL